MFLASTCPSSGGQTVLSQHLVSSLSVNGCTVCRMRADCKAHNHSRRAAEDPLLRLRGYWDRHYSGCAYLKS